MDFVTLNKQKSAIKSPDKKLASPRASLKFGKVGQNFVKAKDAGRNSSTALVDSFFCKVNKNSA